VTQNGFKVLMPPQPSRRLYLPALGLVTISSYGSWFYAFGVLLDPIRLATGWSEATLTGSFSAGTVAVGVASIPGGRLVDRVGIRATLAVAGIGGAAGLLAASQARHPLVFAAAAAVAMAFLGGFGFYHITMTAAVRLRPADPTRAIAHLTIWGAFSSAIYLPATAALLDHLSWRATVVVLAAVAFVVLAGAASLLPPLLPEPPEPADDRTAEPSVLPLRQVARLLVDGPQRRAFTAATAAGYVALTALLVYQVPVMTAVGLPLATAATLAGVRGLLQTMGRVPVGFLVRRFGAVPSLAAAFVALGAGGATLAVAGRVETAVVFAVLAGFGIGAFSPLQGMLTERLFPAATLGATMGLYSTVGMVAGAAGPAVAGVLVEATGDRRVAASIPTLAAVIGLAATLRLGLVRGWSAGGDGAPPQPSEAPRSEPDRSPPPG
jgi:MFS family permease